MIDGILVTWNTVENITMIWLMSMLILAIIHFGQKGPF